MSPPFFRPEITADEIKDGQPNARRSLQYLFDDVFVRAPAALAAAVACEPFSNDTPPPSGQTMREPPEDSTPKRRTLHLPSAPHGELDNASSAPTASR